MRGVETRGVRMRVMTTGEACHDAHKATHFSAYARSSGWFNLLIRMQEAINVVQGIQRGDPGSQLPESGECRLKTPRLSRCLVSLAKKPSALGHAPADVKIGRRLTFNPDHHAGASQ